MTSLLGRFGVRLLVALAALLCVPGLVGAAFAQAGAEVVAIEFEGNRRYNDETLRLSLRTKQGQKLDEALLNEDINTLYGFFDTVEVQKTPVAEGVRIKFIVSENEPVTDVVIRGAEGVSEADVRAVTETARGRPLAQFRLDNDVRKVQRLYRLKGYHFAEVTTQVTEFGEGRRVTFVVLEGPHVQVERITFQGNASLVRDKLLDNMVTQESGFLGLRGADFVEETLRQDLLLLQNFHRREGFLDAQVELADLSFSDDREEAFITIAVQEGPAYTVGNVTITGAERFPGGEAALREYVRVTPGRRARAEEIQRTADAIERAYHDEGYFSVVVVPDQKLAPPSTVADIVFRIDESAKVRVRNLRIVGNEITQDKVIRREISVYPGEVLNQNEIDKSANRLRSLGYFNQVSAEVLQPSEGEDPDLRDVQFEVDDTAKTGQVQVAVGASSDLGLIGRFTVTKRNFDWKDWPRRFGDVFAGRAFTGAGQTFVLELAPGSEFSSYRLAFTEPWLFDRPVSFGWNLFFSKFTRFDYDVDRKGLEVTLGRRWTFEGRKKDTVLGLQGTTRLENVDLSDVQRDSAPTAFLAEGDNSLIAERLSLRLDRLDNTLNPTEGWFAQLSTEFGFAGDIRLWKNQLEAKHFWVVHRTEDEREHVLSLGGQIGIVDAQSGSVDAEKSLFDEEFVPIYERFVAGGGSSVRGFSFGGAGPHGEGDPLVRRRPGENSARRDYRMGQTAKSILENDGDPMWGDVLFLASAEYAFPLYEDVLRGVFFVDSGMVRDSFDSSHGMDEDQFDKLDRRLGRSTAPRRNRILANQLAFDEGDSFFSDLRVAVGFGLRVKIPIFGQTPIALDFGFPIRKQSGDDTQVLSFSIARDF